MTMKSDGLNEIAPECFVEISAEDAEKYEVQDGSVVTIASRRGNIQAQIKVSKKAVSGTVFIVSTNDCCSASASLMRFVAA